MGAVDSAVHAQGWNPETEPERSAVRGQLERILAHPIFKNSKRYPAFLGYVVEQALLGHHEQLKERIIGIDVFNCDLDYDTSNSAIVRVTALEVRRRLAQYYHEPGHEHEIRITLHTGSYIPSFQLPSAVPIDTPASPLNEPDAGYPRLESAAPPAEPLEIAAQVSPVPVSPQTTANKPKRKQWWWYVAVAAIVLSACALWYRRPTTTSAVNSEQFDQFWSQIVGAPGAVQLCFGSWVEREPVGPGRPVGIPYIHSMDRIVNLLDQRKKAYLSIGRVLDPGSGGTDQFMDGPVIYIGGYAPAAQMLASGRYGFLFQDRTVWVQDKQRPLDREWRTERFIAGDSRSESYAIVARMIDRSMNRPVIVVAAISFGGAEAATEVLMNPKYMNAFLRNAPENWQDMNMEAVVETQIVHSEHSEPNILATYFWK